MRLQPDVGWCAGGQVLLRQRLGRGLLPVHERDVARSHGDQLAGFLLEKYIDAVQPSGQAPKVHVETPAGVGIAELWFGREHVLSSLVYGGFSHKNAIAVDMYPWRWGVRVLAHISPACNG